MSKNSNIQIIVSLLLSLGLSPVKLVIVFLRFIYILKFEASFVSTSYYLVVGSLNPPLVKEAFLSLLFARLATKSTISYLFASQEKQ